MGYPYITNERFRVVIAGGGTGGHLMPGIALAQEFERLMPGCDVRFHIAGRDLEKTILHGHGMLYEVCGGASMSGGMVNKAKSAWSLYKAYRHSKKLMKTFRPHAVVAVGGYASFCGGRAASRLRIPLFVCEQNTIPGRVVRHLARKAERIFAQWPMEVDLSRKTEVEVIGNPIRRSLGKLSRELAVHKLNLDPDKTTMLIMGGSQGSRPINDGVLKNLDAIASKRDSVQVIHLTGSADFSRVKKAWMDAGMKAHVLPFSNDMGKLFAAADVVLCRAGATTIAELTALGKAMVLVPLPSAKDNHQAMNARYVASQGAAHVMNQDTLLEERTWLDMMKSLVLDPRRLRITADAASFLGRPRAGKAIALNILNHFDIQPDPHLVESERRARPGQGQGQISQRAA